MIRLRRVERYLFRLSFVLFLALTARFGWVSVRHTGDEHAEKTPREEPLRGPPSPLSELQRQVGFPLVMPSALDSAIAQAMGSANTVSSTPAPTPAPPHVRSYLSVQVGPARSELRVDGVLVGRTPYVGQITCQRGKTVKIDLLPPKGMPKQYEIPCLDGEMRLMDEP